jgi:chromosome segregation ATPase
MIIEDQMKQYNVEIEEKEEKIKSIRPTKLQEKQNKVKLLNISKEQANAELRLNQTVSAYKAQQREIDTLRKELINVRAEVKRTKGKIQKCRKKAKEYNTWFQESKKSADETRSQIVSLRAKHETEKVRFEDEIRNI